MFITTTAESLCAFLMVMCGFSLRVFNPFHSSFVRLSCFFCVFELAFQYFLFD